MTSVNKMPEVVKIYGRYILLQGVGLIPTFLVSWVYLVQGNHE